VFVHGEAGIGKTRLCQELRATQDPRRTQVLAGRADPGDAATTFSALADSLRAALHPAGVVARLHRCPRSFG